MKNSISQQGIGRLLVSVVIKLRGRWIMTIMGMPSILFGMIKMAKSYQGRHLLPCSKQKDQTTRFGRRNEVVLQWTLDKLKGERFNYIRVKDFFIEPLLRFEFPIIRLIQRRTRTGMKVYFQILLQGEFANNYLTFLLSR